MTALRVLILTTAAVAVLSGCNRDRDEDRAPVPPAKGDTSAAAVPTGAAAPLTYESQTPYAEVELSLSQALTSQPDLHTVLYQTAVRDLREFNEGAQADRTEAGVEGGPSPYAKSIGVEPAAETGRLLSLKREDYEFTGGAHGNTTSSGILWDKTAKRLLQPAALFRPGANLARLNAPLCAAVNAAKRERDPTADPVTPNGEMWSCPDPAQTPFVLAPGTGGKAGGLMFMVGPYVVGPYAEGGYEVVLPTAVVAPLLAPEYAAEFAGGPAG